MASIASSRCKEIISLIETAKYNAAFNVNAELLALYWKIGSYIIKKLAKIQNNPIWQVPLAELEEKGKEFLQVPLAQITWYHHISLLSKVKDIAERAYQAVRIVQHSSSI